jgi:hypothetical protein
MTIFVKLQESIVQLLRYKSLSFSGFGPILRNVSRLVLDGSTRAVFFVVAFCGRLKRLSQRRYVERDSLKRLRRSNAQNVGTLSTVHLSVFFEFLRNWKRFPDVCRNRLTFAGIADAAVGRAVQTLGECWEPFGRLKKKKRKEIYFELRN